MRWLALLLLAGCPTAQVGTIDLELTAAPGSTLLDAVTRLRVTLTNPRQVVEAQRGPNGFALNLEVDAGGEPGAIVVEGFDANGGRIAGGQSPEFGVAAIDARVVVYMAEPMSVGRAPVSLMPARSDARTGQLTYGVIFAGGRDPTTLAPSDAVAIYNAYDHSLGGGRALPEARDGITIAPGANNGVFLFGGRDSSNNVRGTYWFFDTNVAPSGAYVDLGDFPGFARAYESAFQIGADTFIVTGAPPIEAQGTTVTERMGVPALTQASAFLVATSGARTAIALDTSGRIVRFRDGMFETLTATPRPGSGAVALLPDNRFVVVAGGSPDELNDLLVVDAAAGTVTVMPDVLSYSPELPSIAVTRRHVVISNLSVAPASIDVLDAVTLARIASIPGTAKSGIALPNDQVLLVDNENGELSLFTPPPPDL